MELATLSPFIKAFWHVFHGKDVSNQEARTLCNVQDGNQMVLLFSFF